MEVAFYEGFTKSPNKEKHMAKRRSKKGWFRGFGMLPGVNTYQSSVKGTDVLVGLGVGLAGVILAKYAKKKLTEGAKDDSWQKKLDSNTNLALLTPVVGGLVAGIAAFALQKKSSRGIGHLVGATAFGAALTADGLVKENLAKSTVDAAGASKPGVLQFYAGLEDYAALLPDASPMMASYGALVPSYGSVRADRGYAELPDEYS